MAKKRINPVRIINLCDEIWRKEERMELPRATIKKIEKATVIINKRTVLEKKRQIS
jgi:hypothetical protein